MQLEHRTQTCQSCLCVSVRTIISRRMAGAVGGVHHSGESELTQAYPVQSTDEKGSNFRTSITYIRTQSPSVEGGA